MKTKSILALILVALFFIILIQNVEVVEIRFLFWVITMSRIVFIPFVLIIGFILGFIFAKSHPRKVKKQ